MKSVTFSNWKDQLARNLGLASVLAVFLLAGLSPANAEVLGPNEVALTAEQWQEKSPDGAGVTVRDALSGAGNSQIVAAVKSNGAPYLNLSGSDSAGTIWWPGGSGSAYIDLKIINASGSVVGNCQVSSAKGTNGVYQTNCN